MGKSRQARTEKAVAGRKQGKQYTADTRGGNNKGSKRQVDWVGGGMKELRRNYQIQAGKKTEVGRR